MVIERGFRWRFCLGVLTLMMCLGSVTYAADVFLNGVKVTGLSNQNFDDATVRFDEKGDVHITVKNVQVQTLDPGAANQRRADPATLQKRYWLVGKQNVRGMTQYNIDVHINGQFVLRFKNNEMQQVKEVTKYLLKGRNEVVFTAMKVIEDQRRSFSPEHEMTILIGEGDDEGKQLTITQSLIEYKRFASQVENHTATETIEAR